MPHDTISPLVGREVLNRFAESLDEYIKGNAKRKPKISDTAYYRLMARFQDVCTWVDKHEEAASHE